MKPLAPIRSFVVSGLACTALCSNTPGQSAPPALPAHGDLFPAASPESQGVSAEALEELAAVVHGYLERDLALGAELVVIKNRHLVSHEVFGHSDREADQRWEKNTICNLRSMTKSFTGAAIQILIDREQVALDDPAAKYLPGFDNDASRAITIDQLLTHTSGLPLTVITQRIDQYENLQAQANAAGEGEPEFPPGSKFWYSDAGSDALGAIVEVVSGMPLHEFWRKELFEPLGMSDTFVAIDATDPRFPRIAPVYFGSPGEWTRFWTPAGGEPLYPFAWGSQTAYGTAIDYAKFLAMWMDEGRAGEARILSSEAVARTLEPVSIMKMLGSDQEFPCEFDALDMYYGRLAQVYVPNGNPEGAKPVIVGHGGSDGTMAWAWPEEDLMILYFTQSRGGTSVLRIEDEIERIFFADQIVVEEVNETFAPYLGTYVANFPPFDGEEFEVLVKNGKLALDIPSQMVFELIAPSVGEDRWKFALMPEAIAVEFLRDEAGEVNLLRIHQQGMIMDSPRTGTALAEAGPPVVEPAEVEKLLGRYRDAEAKDDVEIALVENVLTANLLSEAVSFKLQRSADDPLTWTVWSMPTIEVHFTQNESGEVISLTRTIGDEETTLTKVTDEPRL